MTTAFCPRQWFTGSVTSYDEAADYLLPDASEVEDIGIGLDDIIAVVLDGGCGRTFEAQVLQVRADGQLKVQPVKNGVKVGYAQWVWERECAPLVKASAQESS